MDLIKQEAAEMSDDTDLEEMKPLSEEGNILHPNVTGIKSECVDSSYDVSSEVKHERSAVLVTDPVKCEVEEGNSLHLQVAEIKTEFVEPILDLTSDMKLEEPCIYPAEKCIAKEESTVVDIFKEELYLQEMAEEDEVLPQRCYNMSKGLKYGSWNPTDMIRAMAAYRNGDMGLNAAAREYSVPKATLKRHLEGRNHFAVEGRKVIGSLGDLPENVENELVNHILKLEECFFRMTIDDVRRLAFQVAEKNDIPTRFNKEKQTAGKKWYYNFIRRHPELSLRQPEPTSRARAKCFNRDTVRESFYLLEKIVDEKKLDATRMYNVDEMGLSNVQEKPRKIVSKKGKSQVGCLTTGERGRNISAVCCVSASGFYVPPLLIFKRGRACNDFKEGAPPGTIFAFNPDSSYINKAIFVYWLEHFISTVKPTKEKPVLLLMDGHSTHIQNIKALDIARENGVIMLALPNHTTHRLQPLNVAFFQPLSSMMIKETEKYLREHPSEMGLKVKKITMIFGKAYAKTASLSTAMSAFRTTGVWPVNRNVFQDHHFAPSTTFTTEIDSIAGASCRPNTPISIHVNSRAATYSRENTESTVTCEIGEIPSLPQTAAHVLRNERPQQRAIELMASPYKRSLEEAELGSKTKKRPTSKKGLIFTTGE